MRPQFVYVFFLAVGTAVELSRVFSLGGMPLLDLTYIVGWLVFIFNRNRYQWIWYPGFLMIGLVSLGMLFLQIFHLYSQSVRIADGLFTSYIYFRCMVFLEKHKEEE